MKKLLLGLLMCAGAFGAYADNYLHIKTEAGWTVIDLDKCDRLTFEGGSMKVEDAEGNTVGTYDRQALEQIYVDDSAGVESIVADAGAKATFTFDAASASAVVSADALFEVYALDGRRLVAIPARTGDTITLDAMRGIGAVIIKSGTYTLKTVL